MSKASKADFANLKNLPHKCPVWLLPPKKINEAARMGMRKNIDICTFNFFQYE